MAEQTGDRLKDQRRLSIWRWSARLKRCKVTNSVVCSYHVILLQETESHLYEIAKIATEQFRIYHCVDQLILFHKNTFEPDGVKTEEESPGTSKQASFGLKCLVVGPMFRRIPKQGKCTCTSASGSLQQHNLEEARNCKHAFRSVQGSRRAARRRHHHKSAYHERGRSNVSSIEDAWETTLVILPPDLFVIGVRLRTLETVIASHWRTGVLLIGALAAMEVCN